MNITRQFLIKSLQAATLGIPASTNIQAETKIIDVPRTEVETYKVASGDNLYIYRFDSPGHDPKTDQTPCGHLLFRW